MYVHDLLVRSKMARAKLRLTPVIILGVNHSLMASLEVIKSKVIVEAKIFSLHNFK